MARTTRSSTAKAAAEAVKKEPQQLSSPPSTPAPGSRTRARKAVKTEDEGDVNDLPHNLGTALPTPGADDDAEARLSPPRKRTRKALNNEPTEDLKDNLLNAADPSIKAEGSPGGDDEVKPTPKKTPKKANYGLTPGVSPYPDYPRPTPEACREVVRLLEKVHGKVVAPKAIPPPSLDVSGCGEVPSVLDALVRTRLSANTTNKNSSTAFQGLVKRFGVLEDGIGKGSVDWDAVRRAPQKEVFKAIERGGLADRKSKDIQAILQMAYEENQERRAALASTDGPDAAGAATESRAEKEQEIERADQHVISLDHLHLLSTNDAIEKMLTYPGIGPKTASCVALFCLQRPSFAVDTHVFRLCQYLGWVPRPSQVKKGQPRVDRNTTYSHCDVRIPDDCKYALHQLLIKHGKTCPRCRAITGQGSEGWDKGCPIEHLVKRHGAKKGGSSAKERRRAMEDAGVEAEVAGKLAQEEEGSESSDAPGEG